MFTCLDCAKKLVEVNRLSKGQLMFFNYPLSISYGQCEFCLETKETVDYHHSIIAPMEQEGKL